MRRGTKSVLWHLFMASTAAAGYAAWRWQLRWGATAAEQRRVLPGDDAVPGPSFQATRAIGIAAPPAIVWPWLVQLGYGRGGFYQRFDAVGPDGEDAEPVAEWQDLKVGDTVYLTEAQPLRVAVAEPGRALVLEREVNAERPAPFEFSWAFVLEPEGPTGSRLVVRERYAWPKGRTGLMVRAISWIGFALSRRLLLGIRFRAERSWRLNVAARLDDAVSDVLEDAAAQAPDPAEESAA
jgi:hypothetical protein